MSGRVKGRMEIYDWLQCIVYALVVCVIVFVFFFRTIDVMGHSMEPTLQNGDKLIVSNMFYTPQYGDIVVLRKESFGEQAIVKRVIATEGQTVDIDFDEGIVYVDGVALDEPYIAEATRRPLDFNGEVTVPEGCVFVLGDNRNRSNDSRDADIGMVDTRYIIGRALIRVFPLSEFGPVD
ncbi:MAG TPA: signal peptidase I [Firmicutes bacterium]|nr:signal peptidase I [Bacillota bacterium]